MIRILFLVLVMSGIAGCSAQALKEINKEPELSPMDIGYAGGGVRNIFVNKPVQNLAELKGLKVRVQGAPIWSRTFAATGGVIGIGFWETAGCGRDAGASASAIPYAADLAGGDHERTSLR